MGSLHKKNKSVDIYAREESGAASSKQKIRQGAAKTPQKAITQNDELEGLIAQANAAFEVGKAALCQKRWELVRQRFPNAPQGYIQAGFAALKQGDSSQAENLAMLAIKKFPRTYDAFRLHAEVAMHSHAFSLALSRWARVRKLFPQKYEGYYQSISVALKLKKIAWAERLADQVENMFPSSQVLLLRRCIDAAKQTSLSRKMPDLSVLLDIAEKDMQVGLYKQAYIHFKQASQYPRLQFEALKGAAEASLALQDYRRVERIAKKINFHFSLCLDGYRYLIDSLVAQEEWTRALSELANIKKRLPGEPYAWKKSAEIQLKLGNYECADAEMKEAVRLFPKDLDVQLYFAQMPLHAAEPEIRKSAVERCLAICHGYSLNYNTYTEILNICQRSLRLQYDKKMHKIYCDIFKAFTQHFGGYAKKHDGIATKNKRKLAISGNLRYVVPLIRYFSPDSIDLVTPGDMESDMFKEFKREGYNVLNGYKYLNNYDYVLIDVSKIPSIPSVEKLNCRFIGFTHATDSPGGITPSMMIYEAENQVKNPKILSTDLLPEDYTLPAHADCTCELCYTGPYHLGEFLEMRKDKSSLKAELAEQLGIDIPLDKPLVFILEDQYCHLGQIAYMANQMSRYATVIFKTLAEVADPYLEKFNDAVHVFRSPATPNLPRFAADFICCGYKSGSFTTSVMLGQNVLPYYSRIVSRVKAKNHPFCDISRYDRFKPVAEPPLRTAADIIYLKFYDEGRLFDLVDSSAFENAISGTEYADWYQSILPNLQKEAFGEYQIDGVLQKTADYIMRFVNEGTLGEACSGVAFKKKYFTR